MFLLLKNSKKRRIARFGLNCSSPEIAVGVAILFTIGLWLFSNWGRLTGDKIQFRLDGAPIDQQVLICSDVPDIAIAPSFRNLEQTDIDPIEVSVLVPAEVAPAFTFEEPWCKVNESNGHLEYALHSGSTVPSFQTIQLPGITLKMDGWKVAGFRLIARRGTKYLELVRVHCIFDLRRLSTQVFTGDRANELLDYYSGSFVERNAIIYSH